MDLLTLSKGRFQLSDSLLNDGYSQPGFPDLLEVGEGTFDRTHRDILSRE